MKIIIVLLSSLILLTSCATSYKPLGLSGGYSEMALTEDTYKVSFQGNSYTSQEEVQNLFLRRCAELTLNKGYKYFVVSNSDIQVTTSYHKSPTTVNTSTDDSSWGRTENRNSTTTITPGNVEIRNSYTQIAVIKMLHSNIDTPEALDAKTIASNFYEK